MREILNKVLIICAAAALMLTTACGPTIEKSTKSSIVSPDTPIESKVGDKSADEEDDVEKNEEKDSQSSQTKKSESDNSSEGTYTESVSDSDTFTNEYMGMSFKKPEGYTMYTKDDVNKVMEQLVGETDTASEMTYEAYIMKDDGSVQVIVAVDHNKEQFAPEDYLGGVANGYDEVDGANVDRTIKTASIAGISFAAIEITNANDSMLHCVHKKGSDMIYFVITYPKGNIDAVQTVMNSFEPLEI